MLTSLYLEILIREGTEINFACLGFLKLSRLQNTANLKKKVFPEFIANS